MNEKLHKNWGVEVQPLNPDLLTDCYSAIHGLKETSSNVEKIALMPDTYRAKCALMKELIVLCSNASAMLNRYIPEISEKDIPF